MQKVEHGVPQQETQTKLPPIQCCSKLSELFISLIKKNGYTDKSKLLKLYQKLSEVGNHQRA